MKTIALKMSQPRPLDGLGRVVEGSTRLLTIVEGLTRAYTGLDWVENGGNCFRKTVTKKNVDNAQKSAFLA